MAFTTQWYQKSRRYDSARTLALACFGALLTTPAIAQAPVLSGAVLLDACTRPDHEWIGFCNGYLRAAFDATGGQGICPPDGVTSNDLFDAVIRDYRDHQIFKPWTPFQLWVPFFATYTDAKSGRPTPPDPAVPPDTAAPRRNQTPRPRSWS